MSYTLILHPSDDTATGEIASEITTEEAEALVKAGKAEQTVDGVYRATMVKPAAKKPAKKKAATYKTKDVKAED